MILFDNWTISVIGLVARQYDNLSRRIDVEGDLPDGYTWQLLVQSGGNADTLLLQPTENGAGVVLTADNLSKSGEYYFQLRGVLKADGITKRHTNVVSAHIPKSLTGLGTWPEVPTEFAQVEASILGLYQHPPIPGSNGYWLVWDPDKNEYVESQLPVLEGMDFASPDRAGIIKVGENLAISEDGVLSVITTDTAQQDNTKPITSAGVYTLAGNIEVLLAAL